MTPEPSPQRPRFFLHRCGWFYKEEEAVESHFPRSRYVMRLHERRG
jgi:hypothetical protein